MSNPFTSELVVTMVKVNPDSQPDEGTIWFDYFLVTNSLIQSSSSTTKSKHVGAIVGGVIGSIFFLIVVALALFQTVRRRSRRLNLEHIRPWSDKEFQANVLFRTSFSELISKFKLKTLYSLQSSHC
jgi:hypothetical protein